MKILFVEPYDRTLFSFRKELLDELINQGHRIILCTEASKKVINEYNGKVEKIVGFEIDLKSKNLINNLFLMRKYKKIIKQTRPDLIISYTIKPNIYCGYYAKKIPMIANITGLGNMFRKNNFISRVGIFLYKKSFKNVNYVLFQNQDGYHFFKKNKIPINNFKIIPGSGVNTDVYAPSALKKSDEFRFLFASRAIKEKGFDLLVEAVPIILNKYNHVRFNFLSAEEDIYRNKKIVDLIKKYSDNITILPRSSDMKTVYQDNDFIVLPSFYREGISNVLLESLSCCRPIITTYDNYGCKEVLQDGINGYGVKSKDLDSLVSALDKAVNTPKSKIEKMGFAGREFVKKHFERKIIIQYYLSIIKEFEKN